MTAQLPFNGLMDRDSPETAFPAASHRYARNIRFKTKGSVRPENIPGTRLVENELPDGVNECVGAYYDELKQRVFFFNWNENGYNGIYQYDRITGVVTPLLIAKINSTNDILGFSPLWPIASINILYTTESDGDVLLWTGRNRRPCKLNILEARQGLYGNKWLEEYLTVARKMPLLPPKCQYFNDSTVHLNNQRNKLWQFRYRWIYKDFTSSPYSPYSKLFTPKNPDDLASELDETKNNRVEVVVTTGGADVVKIEIAARMLIEGNSFSDDIIIETLDKAKRTIGSESNYTYAFYNDGAYAYADVKQTSQLFDYVPKRANTQELLNGDTIIYGGITEGNSYDETLDVSSEVVPVDVTSGIALTVEGRSQGRAYAFFFNGLPQTGDSVRLRVKDDDGREEYSNYYPNTGDALTTIRDYFVTFFSGLTGFTVAAVTDSSGAPGLRVSEGLNFLTGDYNVFYSTSTPTTGDIGIAAYRPNSKMAFGLVYFDEYGVTNGVVRMDSMTVITNDIAVTGTAKPTISAIKFSVNSVPPIWAKYFSWVRAANLTAADSFFMVTANTAKDADYGYFEITNLQNNKDSLTTYDWKKGDRIRIVGKYNTTFSAVKDYPVLALLQDPTIDTNAKTGAWVKFPYDASIMSDYGATGFEHYYVEIYSPTANIGTEIAAYYEFGETYAVKNPGTAQRAHTGKSQDQVPGTTPALFAFTLGDYYVRKRLVPITANLATTADIWIVDRSISDKYPSKTEGKGRAFVIDPYGKETYKPTLVRYSLAYQQGTDINETNRFYPQNYDEYDRQRGDIQRFKVRGRALHVFQSRACGSVPIYQQVLSNADGTTNLLQSDQIINNIQYYQEEYGMGNQYCSLASSAGADYFSDPVRGAQLRLARDGLTPISEYGMKYTLQTALTAYLTEHLRGNGGRAKLMGVYDFGENEFITVMQEADTVPAGEMHHETNTTINGFYYYITTAAVPGYVITMAVSGNDATALSFGHYVTDADTPETIIADLINQVNASGGAFSAVPATFGDWPGMRIQAFTGNTEGAAAENFLPEVLLQGDCVSFHEIRNGYGSYYDYYTDWMICAENTLVSWRAGGLYVHDSTVHGQFHGNNYPALIEKIVSDQGKKEFLAVGYHSNTAWQATSITTSEGQQSNLKVRDFVRSEGQWNAGFGRDINSIGGWINGNYLIGQWMKIRLQNYSTSYEFLHHLYVNLKASQRTF